MTEWTVIIGIGVGAALGAWLGAAGVSPLAVARDLLDVCAYTWHRVRLDNEAP